jgi:hypothetical protein
MYFKINLGPLHGRRGHIRRLEPAGISWLKNASWISYPHPSALIREFITFFV